MKIPDDKKGKKIKPSVNLPDQEIWKQLDSLDSELEVKKPLGCEKLKKITGLLDKAFEVLLEKVIRQS